MKRGEVYWVQLPENGGYVQEGLRPCIVISNDVNNQRSPIVNIIPCTTANRKPLPCHYIFSIWGIRNTALCEQITTVNNWNLEKYVRTLTPKEIAGIEKALLTQVGIQ